MTRATVTKQLFADEIIRLAKDRPITQISVTELCRACGTTRQSFYYHFHDKYDLVAWIYLQDLERATRNQMMGTDALNNLLSSMYEKGDFYRNALVDNSQNNLMDYMIDHQTDVLLEALVRKHHKKPTDNLRIAVRYHAYGMLGIVSDWLRGTYTHSTRQMAVLLSQGVKRLEQDFAS